MTEALTNLAAELHKHRQAMDTLEEEMGEVEAEMHASPLGQKLAEMSEERKDIKKAIGAAEQTLREAILEHFQKTGDKSPLQGLGIREYTVLVWDEEEARAWAIADPARHELLKVDKRRFEKLAKAQAEAGMPLPFVLQDTDPRPTIAGDLSDLAEEPDNAGDVPF